MERLASSKIMKQKSSGSRGIGLEKLINHTIEYYREKNLALIQKIPTPIIPMKYSKDKKLISLARFDKKSTVDYIGVVQEVAVCFDAKECEQNRFPCLEKTDGDHKHCAGKRYSISDNDYIHSDPPK